MITPLNTIKEIKTFLKQGARRPLYSKNHLKFLRHRIRILNNSYTIIHRTFRYILILKSIAMNYNRNKNNNNPFTKAVTNFFSKLTQSPDVYPIKFYMKGNRLRRKYTYIAK